ncbi:hypothetical protein Pst134EA_019132 [Puccinia striiformis f. sp. tritici]|uniref:hypothetical protein n=1 Tax=Puccinia striiformis f. sp. tritici TaxID=168172 RepID=UPI002008D97C|nr:hypothetical protein Pst134EA_019132 [Puccinia striiformis f. sp. tritici]KAH9458978.1 hypothetical protein Pst134EA_019132 [Puccinia striiformis f. sp. tritici]
MIVEDERDTPDADNYNYDLLRFATEADSTSSSESDFHQFLQRCQAIQNQTTHNQLKNDLIEHQWALHEKRVKYQKLVADVPTDLSSDEGSESEADHS